MNINIAELLKDLTISNKYLEDFVDSNIQIIQSGAIGELKQSNFKIQTFLTTYDKQCSSLKEYVSNNNITNIDDIEPPTNITKEEFTAIKNDFRKQNLSSKTKLKLYQQIVGSELKILRKMPDVKVGVDFTI